METDAEFAPIRAFFREQDWAQMSRYEKTAFMQKKANYEKMKELGIANQPPQFMQPPPVAPPVRPKRPRAASADSGDEWSPSRHVQPARQARRRTSSCDRPARAARFRPPVKTAAAAAGSSRSEDVSEGTRTKAKAGKKAKKPSATVVSSQEQQLQQQPKQPPPSPPYDFRGFSAEEVAQSSSFVDMRLDQLWKFFTSELRRLGEEAPDSPLPRRNRKKVNYKEEEDLDDDDYIFCDECDREWEGDCPNHGPLVVVSDTKVSMEIGDTKRDLKTLPDFLSAGRSKILDANIGIWTEKDLLPRLRFGPYEGDVTTEKRRATTSGYSWEIKKCRRVHHYVDAGDSSRSNWLRYVNCARFEQEQNVIAFQYKGQMYYRTYKVIPKGSELLVYYGDAYAKELAIDVRSFRKAPPAPVPVSLLGDVMHYCNHCGCGYLEQRRLEAHIKQRHGHIGRNGRHKCEWCDYSTDRSGNMRNHRVTHTGERPFRCGDCGKSFTLQRHLTTHSVLHTGVGFRCDECGKVCACPADLVQHRRIHTGEKVARCEQCGAQFTKQSHYNTHMKAHGGVKPHKCDVCPARFVRRMDLTQHVRTHTGERPYCCSFCQTRFTCQSNMTTHIIVVHTHDYKHRCGRCGKGFIAPSVMRRHVDKCTG